MTTESPQSTGSRTNRVLLAASDPEMRETLRGHLTRLKGIELVGTETTGADAIIAAYRLHPDVILLELTPPDRSAPETIRHLLRVCPGASIAMLVAEDDDVRLTPALDAGARESLHATAPPEELESVIRRLGHNTFSGHGDTAPA